MKIAAAQNHILRCQQDLRQLLRDAREMGMGYNDITAGYLRVLASLPQRRPAWLDASLSAYLKALVDALYRDELLFGAMIEGRFVTTKKDHPNHYRALGYAPSELTPAFDTATLGHYWAGSLQPFSLAA